jgi:hypothetical protein
MTTGVFSIFDNSLVMMRDKTSGEPPAADGTTKVMALSGYSANAMGAASIIESPVVTDASQGMGVKLRMSRVHGLVRQASQNTSQRENHLMH